MSGVYLVTMAPIHRSARPKRVRWSEISESVITASETITVSTVDRYCEPSGISVIVDAPEIQRWPYREVGRADL